MARESEADFRRLEKEEISLRRINTFTAVIFGAGLFFDLTIGHKFDKFMLGVAITFLVFSIHGSRTAGTRLQELRSLKESRNQ